ncbi:MAG: helix-turn-helix domain-containing protein [Clostridia bacterium]|nr:helix-turn-helix domain-containing protein [Clostridia bacterium]
MVFDIPMACRILGKTTESVRKMLTSGELSAQKAGNEWRIRKDKLMEYLGYQPWEIDKYGFGIRPER